MAPMPSEFTSSLREARDVVSLVSRRLRSASQRDRDAAGYQLMVRFARWAAPGYVVTKPGKSWFEDVEFFRDYDRLMPRDRRRSAERKYFLRSLLRLADGLPGDTAECGVYTGASSWFICRHFDHSGKTHHGFDSFAGLPDPALLDGSYWRRGDTRASLEEARNNLAGFRVELYPGWIPTRFADVADQQFCFVHIDVSLYDPTRDCLGFFYPRMVPGGLIVFDDYGSVLQSPGAGRAVDQFMAGRPEPVITSPTAQAFLIKH